MTGPMNGLAAPPLDPPEYRVGFVIDHLVQRGGAERTLVPMMAAAPGAPVYTAFHEPQHSYDEVNDLDIRVLRIGRSALFEGRHRISAPVLPLAFSTTRIDADVVFCATSGWAHGVRTRGRKIAYFQSLARWVHDPADYVRGTGRGRGAVVRGMRPGLARWDRATVGSADRHVTQSSAMRDAIRAAYGVDADVIPLPNALGTEPRMPVPGVEPGFVLYAGRLMPYKHVDLVLAVAAESPDRRFVLAGAGPLLSRLRASAPSNVTFLGDTDDPQLRWLYANAACLLTMANEPFGVTPIEAAALGTPTVARAAGGFLDTVHDGATGRLVEPEVSTVLAALGDVCASSPDHDALASLAARHRPEAFTARIRELLDEEADAGSTATVQTSRTRRSRTPITAEETVGERRTDDTAAENETDVWSRIAAYPFWYHTIDLGDGRQTPGAWDLSAAAEKIPWPDVRGKRCLDIGTFDGWFAFQLEERGAAEVVAVDLDDLARIDWPRDVRSGIGDPGWDSRFAGTEFALGHGFRLAAEARGSSVTWKPVSIYDLDPAELGTFDVVTCGSLLLHLRDPIRALEAVRSVCGGVFVSSEAIDPWLTLLRRRVPAARLRGLGADTQWWTPNLAGHQRMLRSAGFDVVDSSLPYVLEYATRPAPPLRRPGVVAEAALTAAITRDTRRGQLHRALVAQPDDLG